MESSNGTRIKSVARASQILLWIAERPNGATAKEISAAQGLTLSTTYHLVNTLIDQGLLAQEPSRRYVIGRSAAVLARAYLRGETVPEGQFGALRELARRTDETVYLADWGEYDIRVLASMEGRQTVRVAEVGTGPYEHGHARANGKVLLAYAWPELREAYLRSHPPVRLTDSTICDATAFERELEQIREHGYACDEEEYAVGVSCLAAPLFHNGHLVASLGVSVPAERFHQRREELTAVLLDVAGHAQGD